MPRHANKNWDCGGQEHNGRSTGMSWEGIAVAVLMDIRDELQTLNRVFACHNAQDIPHILRRLDRRLAKKIPLKTTKKRKRRHV